MQRNLQHYPERERCSNDKTANNILNFGSFLFTDDLGPPHPRLLHCTVKNTNDWVRFANPPPVSSHPFSPWPGLVWCCLVAKMRRQALLRLCDHCRILRPGVCDVVWWTEPDHGGLRRNGKCPVISNSWRYVSILFVEKLQKEKKILLKACKVPFFCVFSS